jgi:hypothetical protein
VTAVVVVSVLEVFGAAITAVGDNIAKTNASAAMRFPFPSQLNAALIVIPFSTDLPHASAPPAPNLECHPPLPPND